MNNYKKKILLLIPMLENGWVPKINFKGFMTCLKNIEERTNNHIL